MTATAVAAPIATCNGTRPFGSFHTMEPVVFINHVGYPGVRVWLRPNVPADEVPMRFVKGTKAPDIGSISRHDLLESCDDHLPPAGSHVGDNGLSLTVWYDGDIDPEDLALAHMRIRERLCACADELQKWTRTHGVVHLRCVNPCED